MLDFPRRVLVPAAALMVVAASTAAHAGLPRAQTGPFIEAPGGYEGQRKCSPAAKPGVLAFRRIVLDAFPATGAGAIGRACSVGGQSEHKEGRAWDWGVNAGVASQAAAADTVLGWLTATDRFGNEHALARRLGVMYVIWKRRIFFPGSGWQTYCVPRRGACRDPQDGGVRSPHTDHVHFSFTWDGAYKRTTFWHPERSFVADAAARPGGGMWTAGANGGVRPSNGAPMLGARDASWLDAPVTAIAPTPGGWGYYLVTRPGKIFAFGDARLRGRPEGDTNVTDMQVTPAGAGYWLLSAGGRVFAFGDAAVFKRKVTDARAVALAPTPSGQGYWVLLESGRVLAYGDAPELGDAAVVEAVDIESSVTGLGYWVAGANGKIVARGDAPAFGGVSSDAVSILRSPTGLGYWVVGRDGSVSGFGDAV